MPHEHQLSLSFSSDRVDAYRHSWHLLQGSLRSLKTQSVPRIQLIRLTVHRTLSALLTIWTYRFHIGTWAHHRYSTAYFHVCHGYQLGFRSLEQFSAAIAFGWQNGELPSYWPSKVNVFLEPNAYVVWTRTAIPKRGWKIASWAAFK